MAGGELRPIIIKRIEEAGHGHHGGAWKVAYADFVTAMMAFFLMLWLLSSASDDTLKGLAEYFSEAQENKGTPGGVGGLLNGIDMSQVMEIDVPSSPFTIEQSLPMIDHVPEDLDVFELDLVGGDTGDQGDQKGGGAANAELLTDAELLEEQERREREQFEVAKNAILRELRGSAELKELAEHLMIEETPEGLRIQILDRDENAMFPLGSDAMYENTQKLLGIVADAIDELPNKISIRGHTDSKPFRRGANYDNWRLSSDRANATREQMLRSGIPADRITEVVGKADSEHLFADDPLDPRNRRISIVLMKDELAPFDDGEQP